MEYGVVPTHADATKAATAEYTYTFAGWDSTPVAVTGDATYTATFNATKNSYTITWKNDDDSLIDTTTVEYGVVPTHANASKVATDEYTYTFMGWTPVVAAVTGDTTYTATYVGVTGYTGTYDGEAHSITVLAPEGASVTYSTDNSNYGSKNPSFTNAGSYTVYYRVEKANHSTVSGSAAVEIAPKSVTAPIIELSQTVYTYDGSAKEPTVTVKDGETVIPASEYTVSYSNNTNAGTATVTIADKDGGNYTVSGSTTFTINRANINPTVTMNGWTYGGTASEPSVTGNSGNGLVTYAYKVQGADDSTYTATKPSNAGSYTVKATVAATTNYNGGTATADFTIAKAALSVTAKNKTITYGDAPANDGVNYSGFVNNETASVLGGELSYTYNYSRYGNVGSYTITPSGLTSDNYDITFNNGSLSVEKRPITVTANDQTVMLPDTITTTGDDVFTLSSGTLADGQMATVTVATSETEAGTYTGGITVDTVTIMDSVTDVTANYAITMAAGDLTIEATARFKVTYMVDGAQSGEADTVDYGKEVTLREVPTKTGYTAVWTTEDAEIEGDGFKMPQNKVTLTAEWTANEYTVTLNPNDDSSEPFPTVTATFDAAMPTMLDGAEEPTEALPIPTRTGYVFSGYYDAESEGTQYYNTDGTSAENVTWDKAENTTLYAQWTKLNEFTHSDNFSNTSYIYRVGNANAVKLGAIFELDTSEGKPGDNTVMHDDVTITVTPHEGSNVGAEPIYSKNASDWTQSTLKFTGTGPITITIQESETGKPYTMDLEIVAAKNVTAYSELSNTSCVLLTDITMSSGGIYDLSNGTLYGNGFTFDVTAGKYGLGSNGYESTNGVVRLSNANLDNVRIVGKVYPSYGGTRTDDYNFSCVLINGGYSKIVNSYISNCAAPVRARGGASLYIENSTLKGGCLSNLDIRSGVHVTVNGLTTINQVANNDAAENGTVIVGLGILFYFEGLNGTESLTIEGAGLTQYNSIANNQKNNAVSIGASLVSVNPVDMIFNGADDRFVYTDSNDVKWVNTGILSLTPEVGQGKVSEISGYDWDTVSAFGENGNLYTKLASAQNQAPGYSASSQYAIAPTASFEYPDAAGRKNYLAKTEGSNDYCYWDSSISSIQIGFDEGSSRSFDPNILTITKNGKTITPTVSMNGGAYQAVSNSITFDTSGEFTLTYKYTDPYNYRYENGELRSYEMTYTKSVALKVTAAKASIKPAEFAFGSNGSIMVTGTDNITYVMPNVTATSTASIGSKTAGGKTVYYPMVYVKYNKNNNASSVSSTNATTAIGKSDYTVAYCPIFDGVVTITDYDDSNNPIVYGSSTTTKPSGLTFVSDISTGSSFLSWSNGATPPTNNPVVVSNKLYLQSLRIQGVNRDQTNYVCEYSYTDTAGNVYHYFVGYIFPAKGTGLQMISNAGKKFTVTVVAGDNGTVSGTTTITDVPYGETPKTTTADNSATYKVNNKTAAATPNADYKFSSWTNGSTRVTSNLTVTANFSSINSSSGGGDTCIPSGSMITLADGTKKPVEDITASDRVLVFNHETGSLEAANIIFTEADGVADYSIINLGFSDGSTTRLIFEHGYFDLDLMRYVYIHEDNYNNFIGHRFAKLSGGGIEAVTLTDAWLSVEHTGCFSFVTVYHLNFIADDFLSMPGACTGMMNFFSYDANLKYNEAEIAEDIETYGLMSYEDFADIMSYEEYSVFPAQYIAISLGKGLMTQEWLEYLIAHYVVAKR